jgi:hypothetical protein
MDVKRRYPLTRYTFLFFIHGIWNIFTLKPKVPEFFKNDYLESRYRSQTMASLAEAE